MANLWRQSLELFRRHLVLWVPCSVAGILMLVLGEIEKAEIHWVLNLFASRHSVLGGTVLSTDWAAAQHRAMMIIYPIGTLKKYLEICLFVAALVITKELVGVALSEQRLEITGAVRGSGARYREVLLFSIKYMAVMAALGAVLILLGTAPIPSEPVHRAALSKPFLFLFSLAGEGAIAWLLLPSAARLLRSPNGLKISNEERRTGTILAVLTSAVSIVLEYSIGKAEAIVPLSKGMEWWAVAVANTVIINAPQVFLFIALALLAIQGASGEQMITAEPELNQT